MYICNLILSTVTVVESIKCISSYCALHLYSPASLGTAFLTVNVFHRVYLLTTSLVAVRLSLKTTDTLSSPYNQSKVGNG